MKRIMLCGFPCTKFSIAQKNNRETQPYSGEGWELFLNGLIAKEKFKPDYFLFENNFSISKPIKEAVSRSLGVDNYMINSSLVSAQNRKREYWFSWECGQPEDKGILLRDILEGGVVDREKSYCLDAHYYKTMGNTDNMVTSNHCRNNRSIVFEPISVLNINPSGKGMNGAVSHVNGKSRCLTTNKGEGQKIIEPMRIDTVLEGTRQTEKARTLRACYYKAGRRDFEVDIITNGQLGSTGVIEIADGTQKPIYEVRNGLITIKGKQYHIKLPDGYYIIRKLTVTECCRLQTMPDDYCRAVSNTQAYKGLGNGWTAEVIIHILRHMNIPLDEEIQVLSMYDGIGTGRYCFDKMGYRNVKYRAYEIDKYAKQVAMSNYNDIIQCGDAFSVRNEDWGLIV